MAPRRKLIADEISLKGGPLQPGETEQQYENPLPNDTQMQEPQPQAAQQAQQQAQPQSGVSALFSDPEKLRANHEKHAR